MAQFNIIRTNNSEKNINDLSMLENYDVLPINIDKIDFGMVGTFDLDSERGHQQHFLMSLLSYIGSNGGLRTKINEILEDIHDKNLTHVKISMSTLIYT